MGLISRVSSRTYRLTLEMLKLSKMARNVPFWANSALATINYRIKSNINEKAFTPEIANQCNTYFGKGKSIRPILLLMLSRYLNDTVNEGQQKISMIAEMIHTSSLMHDDVVDQSDLRRGQKTANSNLGDIMMGIAMSELAKTNNNDVIRSVSKILTDLVEGELLQASTKFNTKSWDIYLSKTFLKTGSLIANTSKSVAILSECPNQNLIDDYYSIGKDIGIAFQIIDDCLDFTSDDNITGKPSQGADIKMGLVTAPLLYAAEKYPKDVKNLINEKNVSGLLELVKNSDSLSKSHLLASNYASSAMKTLKSTAEHNDLSAKNYAEIESLVNTILTRNS